jgi:hypothetical protein
MIAEMGGFGKWHHHSLAGFVGSLYSERARPYPTGSRLTLSADYMGGRVSKLASYPLATTLFAFLRGSLHLRIAFVSFLLCVYYMRFYHSRQPHALYNPTAHMVNPTTFVINCGLFATRKLHSRYRLEPTTPATMFQGWHSGKKLIIEYMIMNEQVPAHCINSLSFTLSP